MRKEDPLNATHRTAEHCSDEKGGSEHPPRCAAHERQGRGHNLQRSQYREQTPGVLSVHRLVYEVVARSHYLWSAKIADQSNQEPGHGGLQILRPTWQRLEWGPEKSNDFRKNHSRNTSRDPQHDIRQQLGRPFEGSDGNAEKRFRAQKPPFHYYAGNSRENDGAKNSRTPSPNDFLNHKKDCRNGSIKRR